MARKSAICKKTWVMILTVMSQLHIYLTSSVTFENIMNKTSNKSKTSQKNNNHKTIPKNL